MPYDHAPTLPSGSSCDPTKETVAFWREREARFRALPGPTHEMYGCYTGGIVAARRHTAESSARLLSAIRDPEYAIEAVYSLARHMFGVAAVVVGGGYVRQWIIAGGPPVKGDYQTLHDRFRSEAVIAAVGAQAAQPDASDQEAIDAWLNILKRARSPYYRGDTFPWIDDLPAASAAMCAWYATRAYQHQVAKPREAEIVETHTDASGESAPAAKCAFPNRAAWLERMLRERDWNAHDVDGFGPSWKTVRKISRGERVREAGLEKLVQTLSQKKGPVSRADVPND